MKAKKFINELRKTAKTESQKKLVFNLDLLNKNDNVTNLVALNLISENDLSETLRFLIMIMEKTHIRGFGRIIFNIIKHKRSNAKNESEAQDGENSNS